MEEVVNNAIVLVKKSKQASAPPSQPLDSMVCESPLLSGPSSSSPSSSGPSSSSP
ncbi:hypothetical protein BS47DRAFT_1467802, partial [Hydnum rufescens UP504]